MVLHKCGDRLYSGLTETLEEHLRRLALRVVEAKEENFLAELSKEWNSHKTCMTMIRDILMYMVRAQSLAML